MMLEKNSLNDKTLEMNVAISQKKSWVSTSVDEFPTWHGKTTSKVWLFSHDCNQIFSYFGIF